MVTDLAQFCNSPLSVQQQPPDAEKIALLNVWVRGRSHCACAGACSGAIPEREWISGQAALESLRAARHLLPWCAVQTLLRAQNVPSMAGYFLLLGVLDMPHGPVRLNCHLDGSLLL